MTSGRNVPRQGDDRKLLAWHENGQVRSVKTLMRTGAKLDGPIALYFGRTPLQAVTENGHGYVVRILLASGADVNSSPSRYRGTIALWGAAVRRSENLVQVLSRRQRT
jgi:hypothetical protein